MALIRIILGLLCIICATPIAESKDIDAVSLYHAFEEDQTPVEMVNHFSVRNFSDLRRPTVNIERGSLSVELITPLNSMLHIEGAPIRAKVISSRLANGVEWLPRGTFLDGTIEGVQSATYGRTDGALCLRFYAARFNDETFEITCLPKTKDALIHPTAKKPTKKAIARQILMSASFIAIPMAIGSGGTSIALTTGAGAIIGGVFADDGKHISGAVNGAWEGSGLGFFDPIVKKGKSVVLPAGTRLELTLQEPIREPLAIFQVARSEQKKHDSDQTAIELSTKETVLHTKAIDPKLVTEQYQRLIAQNNLAGAIGVLDEAIASDPDNKELQDELHKLTSRITGSDAVTSKRRQLSGSGTEGQL